ECLFLGTFANASSVSFRPVPITDITVNGIVAHASCGAIEAFAKPKKGISQNVIVLFFGIHVKNTSQSKGSYAISCIGLPSMCCRSQTCFGIEVGYVLRK